MTDITPASQTLHDPVGDSGEAAPSRAWTGRVPLLVLLAIGIFFLVNALRMSWGTLAQPGPGQWPTIVCVVLVGVTVVALVVEKGTYAERFTADTVRALAGFVGLVATAYVFSYTGLILAGALFLVGWLRFLARESWLLSVAVAIGASLACYFLFVVALGVHLPDDVVAQLWGGR